MSSDKAGTARDYRRGEDARLLDHGRVPIEIAPGAVHVPGWLNADEQRALVRACREWSRPPAGMRAVRTRGGVMSARTACLGWYWYPYGYSRTADDEDGAPVKAFPAELGRLGRRAIDASTGRATPPTSL